MKNQYFGDKRDLLKFSLLELLVHRLPTIEQLTCVWLLTPPSANNDGNRHFRESAASTDLAKFLRRCVNERRRDVREFASYMNGRKAGYLSYGDEAAMYFTAASRSKYFASIPAAALRRSVVFFDPDNGVEPRSVVTAAHIKLAELRGVFERMDNLSAAVVYQHLPRESAETFWIRTAGRVRDALNASVGFVAGSDVGFLIALREQVSHVDLADSLISLQKGWGSQLRTGFSTSVGDSVMGKGWAGS